MEEQKLQPTKEELKLACLLFPGPCLNYRASIQSAQRRLRSIAEAEFKGAVKELSDEGFGSVQTLRIARVRNPVAIFCKKKPTDPSLQPWAFDICTKEQYAEKYSNSCHKAITPHMREFLIARGFFN